MIFKGVDNLKLYIIRHGETEWNIQKRLQGWNNSDLTQKGITDAMNLAERLKDIDFTHIFSSDQKRAVETAKILRKDRDLAIVEMDGLKEIGFGKWEGMGKEDLMRRYKDEFDIFLNKPHLYKPTLGGESYQDIFKRVGSSLEEIIKTRGRDILIVSHGVTIKILTAVIKDIPIEDIYTIGINKGTALNICQVKEDKIEFIVEGDISHMK